MIESEYLPAVIAHELGHLNSSDGNLTAALNRLVVNSPPWAEDKEPQRQRLEIKGDERLALTITFVGLLLWLGRKLLVFAKGGFALRLLAPFWGAYWREREYLADAYAVKLGQGAALAEFLEVNALAHDYPVPFIWLTEHTHPPTELRLDRLPDDTGGEADELAEGPEPVKAAPSGPPAAGPDGPSLTEPGPSAERSITAAGRALPRISESGR
jgi:hypothetical protein